MPHPDDTPKDRTEIRFDLRSILTEEELIGFQQAAKEAGAKDVTEHLINMTLKPRLINFTPDNKGGL